MTPGIHLHVAETDYHALDAFSRSFAWSAYSKTWAHAVGEVRQHKAHFDVGTAIHRAILEPSRFEGEVLRGPIDRRGNKWKDAAAEAEAYGYLLLTAGDYDDVMRVCDAVHAVNAINQLIDSTQSVAESTAIWTDQQTGVLCKVRPDLVRPDRRIMLDLKSSVDASYAGFQRAIGKYGYHLQADMYPHGWQQAGGCEIDEFMFLVVEKTPPFAAALYVYEDPLQIGFGIFRQMVSEYSANRQSGIWPSYPGEPQVITPPQWVYPDEMGMIFTEDAA